MTDLNKSLQDRLDRIEAKLEVLADVAIQAPVMLSMATDSADEMIGQAKRRGIDVDERFRNGLHLLGRLSNPEVGQALNGLIDFIEQSPGLISMLADSLDDEVRRSNQGSIRLDDRIAGIRHIINKLSDPEMVKKLDGVLKLAEQAPGLSAMMIDSADEFMRDHSSLLDPDHLKFVSKAGEALSEAQKEPVKRIKGVLGFYRAINNVDNQKALGFLMNVLKKFGQKI